MVAIGRMMMNDPHLMLLDEPSLGLAPSAIQDMAAALVALRQQGRSLLLVEQRVDLALQVCDRIYVLVDGRVIDERQSREVVGRPAGSHRRLSRARETVPAGPATCIFCMTIL